MPELMDDRDAAAQQKATYRRQKAERLARDHRIPSTVAKAIATAIDANAETFGKSDTAGTLQQMSALLLTQGYLIVDVDALPAHDAASAFELDQALATLGLDDLRRVLRELKNDDGAYLFDPTAPLSVLEPELVRRLEAFEK